MNTDIDKILKTGLEFKKNPVKKLTKKMVLEAGMADELGEV